MTTLLQNDDDITALTPKPKEYLVGVDGFKNLFVRVRPNGSKNYQCYYSKDGQQQKLVLPSTKKITLAFAKGYAVACQVALKAGHCPRLLKEQGRLAVNPLPFMQERQYQSLDDNTLSTIIKEWFVWKFSSDHIYSESTLHRWKSILNPILDEFGATNIQEINTTDLFYFFSSLNARSHDKANKGIDYLNSIFIYATIRGFVEKNPCVGIKRLLHTKKPKNQPAITQKDDFLQLIKDIHAFDGCFLTTSYALRLLPYLFVRIGDFCRMRWEQIDLEKKEWVFVPQKQPQMKSSEPKPFVVPLSWQACDLLKEIRAIAPNSPYVFSSIYDVDSSCIDNSTLNKALSRMGYKDKHSTHGFRASAKSLLVEQLGYSHDITELQLDHAITRSHGGAYDRTQYLAKRKEMMQAWADFITPAP